MRDASAETILIVDDEPTYRMMLRGLLRRKGFNVVEAEDGEDGIATALEILPDLILMDVNMPKLKGSEAVRRLKSRPETSGIPVIVVSGREEAEDLLASFEYGASDYVRKVFHHEELLARIKTHLSISNLRKQLIDANERLTDANESLRHNLRYAGEIQQSILAQVLPEADGYAFSGAYRPCEETSGDYYSAFWIDEEHIGVCIADASGHGIGAAMLAVFLKGQLESIMRVDGSARGPIRPPAEVASIINHSICAKQFGREFISAVYGIFSLPNNEFHFVNAGHPYPVLIDVEGRPREIVTENTVLGLFDDVEYADERVTIQPGETLLFYTDGIVEARRADNEQYGIDRLLATLGINAALSTDDLAERIIGSVDRFAEGLRQEDDITLLLFRRETS